MGAENGVIGVAIAASAIVQIPFAVVAGMMITRWGSTRTLLFAGLVYATGAAMLTMPAPLMGFFVLATSRGLVGIGIVLVLAAAYSIVPDLVPAARVGLGLAVVAVADNIAFAIAPLISTALYDAQGMGAVGLTATLSAMAGCLLVALLLARTAAAPKAGRPGMSDVMFKIETRWVPVMAVTMLTTLYFGAALAFLSPRAESAGLNAGLFFSANGVAILLLKVPTGFLADIRGARALTALGILFTVFAVVLLIAPPTTGTIVLGGLASGAGAAFTSSALMTTLARRSTLASRGAAYSASGMAQSTGIAAGGLVGAAFVYVGGFELAMGAALAALALALVIVQKDRWEPWPV